METFQATLVGIAPLMVHNGRLADPTDPGSRELGKLTKTRGKAKTDDVMLEIKRLEWMLGLYLDEDKEPCLPASVVMATMVGGAKKSKNGMLVKAGVFPAAGTESFKIEYDGPRTVDAMWTEGRFCDYRGVVVNQKRVMRARPIFRHWRLKVKFDFAPDIIDRRTIAEAFEKAGQLVGLCELRPQMGRFLVEASPV